MGATYPPPPELERIQQVRIGPITYRVEYVYDLHDQHGESVHGTHYAHHALIEIEARLDAQEQRVTLWHEILHAVLHQAGYSSDAISEDILELLSYGILEVLIDNRSRICSE